jgi:hypothetical protein
MRQDASQGAILTTAAGAIVISVEGSEVTLAPPDLDTNGDAVRISFTGGDCQVDYRFRTLSEFFHALERSRR